MSSSILTDIGQSSCGVTPWYCVSLEASSDEPPRRVLAGGHQQWQADVPKTHKGSDLCDVFCKFFACLFQVSTDVAQLSLAWSVPHGGWKIEQFQEDVKRVSLRLHDFHCTAYPEYLRDHLFIGDGQRFLDLLGVDAQLADPRMCVASTTSLGVAAGVTPPGVAAGTCAAVLLERSHRLAVHLTSRIWRETSRSLDAGSFACFTAPGGVASAATTTSTTTTTTTVTTTRTTVTTSTATVTSGSDASGNCSDGRHKLRGVFKTSRRPASSVIRPIFMDEDKLSKALGLASSEMFQAVEQGKAVIDGGATRSIGSIYALPKVAELNEQERGRDGVRSVDVSDRPSFGFGNSFRDQCTSTACLEVPLDGQQSLLKVHALDKGTAPILMSVNSLRKLGAIIDFENDLAVFRRVNDRRVLKLERTAAGHQVMPLTDDAFQNAVEACRPVPALNSYI
eukprot:s1724_g10.t1